MKYVYTFEDCMYPNIRKIYHVGDQVLVYSRHNNNTGNVTYEISKKHAVEGYPGNMNHDIKRFHGWRGEYNNVATYAHGVYTIKAVEVVAGKHAPDEYVKITLNRTDIKKGED